MHSSFYLGIILLVSSLNVTASDSLFRVASTDICYLAFFKSDVESRSRFECSTASSMSLEEVDLLKPEEWVLVEGDLTPSGDGVWYSVYERRCLSRTDLKEKLVPCSVW